jgi:hypothetical protein
MTMIADLLTSSPKQAAAVLDEVGWHCVWTDTSDISQRAIVMILKTCGSPEEVRAIDKHVGWPGLDWDLIGSYQDEFDQLKR